ncbi:hypothetical protein ACFWWT_13815 [Streptomyces sp. NPDC058676]|uniref:hypothetical protein n=1 Tax=unclassified Streptomyces TaxID=2593676 RepID=UPI003659F493
MSTNFSRRRLLATGAGVALGSAATVAAQSPAGAAPVAVSPGVREETRSLDELYAAAVAEDGKLVLYQGGDVDSQAAGVRTAFGT